MKLTFFVHIFQMDVKACTESFSMLELKENVASFLGKIIADVASFWEQLAAIEKLLVGGSVTHLLLGVY